MSNATNADHVLAYVERGWRVLPLWKPSPAGCTCPRGVDCERPGKHPRTRNGVHDATTDRARILRWRWEGANVGIATGAESGLVVLDIDPRSGGDETIARLQDRLGVLPESPAVITGGGGRHLYFAFPAGADIGCPMLGPGLDVRGQGGYVVAPPSIHPSGRCYQWQRPPDAGLPPLPKDWIAECHIRGRKRAQDDTGGLRSTEEDERHCSRHHFASQNERPFAPEDFADAIARTLPFGPGTRHRMLFELARVIQSDPGIRGTDPRRFRAVVDAWFHRAQRKAAEEGWAIRAGPEETWWDFVEGWNKVRWPKGSLMTQIIEKARASIPRIAERYSSREIRLLVAVCRELRDLAGGGTFFLATGTAAEILGYRLADGRPDRKRAWRILRGLVMDGVLRVEDSGSPTERRAAVFSYLGD